MKTTEQPIQNLKFVKPNLSFNENGETKTVRMRWAVQVNEKVMESNIKTEQVVKAFLALAILVFSSFSFAVQAQESFGKTLNVGLGVGGYSGYYGHSGRSLPVFHIDYEIDVAKDFTLAPFINVYSYSRDYFWGNNNSPSKNYFYRQTVIPIGVKGSYYFDDLLNASSKWDFYLAGSVGFSIVASSWDAGYNGDRNYYKSPSPLFLDIHIGAEYHFNKNIGAFLDLSSGVSTVGIAIHGIKAK